MNKLRRLKELLAALRDGEEVVLSRIPAQGGFTVEAESLRFYQGEWQLTSINCYSSEDLGLGTCRCVSHTPTITETISRARALALLKELIVREADDEKKRAGEIAWLDQAISQLEARGL